MPTVEHSICILRSHFVSEVHRMQIPSHTTHSPLYRLPVHNDNNNKGATKVHDKSYGIVSPQLPIWKDKKPIVISTSDSKTVQNLHNFTVMDLRIT